MSLAEQVKRPSLTVSQRRVLDSISRMTDAKGHPPSMKEVTDDLGYKSPNAVFDHVNTLKKKGYLLKTSQVARGLIVIN